MTTILSADCRTRIIIAYFVNKIGTQKTGKCGASIRLPSEPAYHASQGYGKSLVSSPSPVPGDGDEIHTYIVYNYRPLLLKNITTSV